MEEGNHLGKLKICGGHGDAVFDKLFSTMIDLKDSVPNIM